MIFCFINPYSYYIQRDFFRPSGIHEYFIHSFDLSYARRTSLMAVFLLLCRLQLFVDNNACTEIKQVILYISSHRFEITELAAASLMRVTRCFFCKISCLDGVLFLFLKVNKLKH